MHQDDRHPALGHEREHVRIVAAGGDVVDEVSPCIERRTGNQRVCGVDTTNHRESISYELKDREDAPNLLVSRHGLRARTRGFTADIDEVRTSLDHASG